MPSRTIVSRTSLCASHAIAARYPRKTMLAVLIHFALCGTAIVAVAHTSAVHAQSAVEQRSFQVAAGQLEDALNQFARQAGITLSFDPVVVSGRQAAALNGVYTVEQGFAMLLAGSGLQAVRNANGAYGLRETAQQSASEATLPSVSVTANVSAPEGYAPPAISIGKGQQALKDVPQSVTVISRQRMDDQALYHIDDVMAQVAGISMTTNGFYGSSYTARGLSVNRIRYDGGTARSSVGYFRNGDDDMAPFDHVEVLRGADGLFSGAGEAGGVVNLNYKRPAPVFQAHGELTLGSWNNRRVEADISGPLALDGHMRGRLVAAHQDRDYFYDHGSRRTSVFYGALEIDLGPDTLLFTGIDHQSANERGTSWGHPRYRDGSPLQVDRRTNFTAPWSWADSERTITFAQLEHQLNADWKTQLRLEHYDGSIDHHTARVGGPIEPADPIGRYWGASWEGDAKHVAADLLIKGGFDWLGRRHDVTLGMDWSRTKAHLLFKNPDFGSYVTTGLNPVVVPPMPEKFLNGPQEIVDFHTVQHGVYGALQLRPVEHWTLIAGARYAIKDRHDD